LINILYLCDSHESRKNGLKLIKILDENSGILFTFPSELKYTFTNKDIPYGICAIFFDKNYNIVNKQLVKPFQLKFNSPSNFKYVIECHENLYNNINNDDTLFNIIDNKYKNILEHKIYTKKDKTETKLTNLLSGMKW